MIPDQNNYVAYTTATTAFTVGKADVGTPTVTMNGYTYGSTPDTPSIGAFPGESDANTTVSYYYTTNDTATGGTAWDISNPPALDAGTYNMYAVVDGMTNYNGFTTAVKGFTVSPITDPVTVTITGTHDVQPYSGGEHTVLNYAVVSITGGNGKFTEANFTYIGTDADKQASQTNVGTAYMALADTHFTQVGNNFETVHFDVTPGYMTITPLSATVTITGHTDTKPYSGNAYTVSGYDVDIACLNDLYDASYIVFSGDDTATRTDVGQTNMNLVASQFTNNNGNFDVSFTVASDGYMKITPFEQVTVTITGNNDATAVYGGQPHEVSGYTVSISDATGKYTEADFTFSGDATASQTDVGTKTMGLKAEDFTNTNANFYNVSFDVIDGYQTVAALDVRITITGATDSQPYDGSEHTASGYTATADTTLYDVSKITCSGSATAAQTDVGKTTMGLDAGMFAANDSNFNPTFVIGADGYMQITMADQATPTAVFEASGPSTGTLTGLVAGGKYTVSGAATGETFTLSGSETTHDITGVTVGTVSLVKEGDSNHNASDAQSITIEKMATPALTPTQPKSDSEKGSIPTENGVHEFSSDGQTWTLCTGATDNLDPGTYYVRAKYSGAKLTSEAQTITIDQAFLVTVSGGTVNGKTSDYFIAGQQVTVTATVPSGKEFVKWTSDYITAFDTATSATSKFTMVGQNVTVTATFKDKPISNNTGSYSGGSVSSEPTYPPVIAKTEHGTVTTSPMSPMRGATVTVTPKPDAGYETDTLTITDAKGNPVTATKNADGTYTFKQPEGKVTITATFKEKEAENPTPTPPADDAITVAELLEMFGDLDPNGWYLDGILYCVNNDLMHGMGDGSFGPGLTASRAMMVQILWNMAGNPAPNGDAPFTDVADGAWYAKAVAWAYETGIVKGMGDGTFGVGNDITREQLAVMLYNFAKQQGKGFTGLWSFKLDFPDAGEVSDWATEAISWMVMNGIINGTTDAEGNVILDPQGDATRAQLATMVQRFCELMK